MQILIIYVSRIGDTLLTTPMMRAIAKAFPEAEITVLGHPDRYEILKHLPFVHHIGPHSQFRAHFKARIFPKKFDYAFVLDNDKSTLKYALRVAKRVVAFRQKDEKLNRKFYKTVEPPPPYTLHSVPKRLVMTDSLNIESDGTYLSYIVSENENAWAKKELGKIMAIKRPIIGLQIASFPTKSYRDWPVNSFKALCSKILEKYPEAHFLIFGGKLEKKRTDELKEYLKEKASLYAGKITLRQTGALMKQIDLYIGVDTGPTHIMGAHHKPLVVLYHALCPSKRLGPLEHPCFYPIDLPEISETSNEDRSLAEISVDTVWNTVDSILCT